MQESRRRGDTDLPELSVARLTGAYLAVDCVMTEGGIADRELAALALKQASGDNVEAIFRRAPTAPRWRSWRSAEPLDTTGMRLERRISAIYKDIPGGQLLGHLRLHPSPALFHPAGKRRNADAAQPQPTANNSRRRTFSACWRVRGWRSSRQSGAQPDDITRTPPVYPLTLLPPATINAATKVICWRWPTPPTGVVTDE
ncbi:carbon-phosphorus lyase complex subunit PhnI [Shigella sonnei]